MITFLPYPDYRRSAVILDWQRLGQQRSEGLWVAESIILGKNLTQPLVRMWKPWLNSLIDYGKAICEEWVSRGHKDDMWIRYHVLTLDGGISIPPWLGSPKLHQSHRANLTRKNAAYYGKFWTEAPSDVYFWPTSYYLWSLFE